MRAIPAQTRRHLRDIRSDTNLAAGPTLQALDTGKRQKPFRLGCMGNMGNMGQGQDGQDGQKVENGNDKISAPFSIFF